MKSMLSQFKKIQSRPIPQILNGLNISESKLLDLCEMWIMQGNLSSAHPVFKVLKTKKVEALKLKKQNQQAFELQKYRELRRRKCSDSQISAELHYPYDKLNSLLKKWYNYLRGQGLSDEAIGNELYVSKRELLPIITAYEERQRIKEETRLHRLTENRRYARSHLKRIYEDLKGSSEYFIFDTEAVQCPDELIEIAIIDCKGNTVYDTLIRPTHKINWRISALTGITNQMVADKPSIHEVMQELQGLISGKTLMSWGIDYDSRLLESAVHKTGIDLGCNICCAQKIHMGLFDNINQIALHKAAGIETQSHRALDDCKMVLDVLKKDIAFIETKNNAPKPRTKSENNFIFMPSNEILTAAT